MVFITDVVDCTSGTPQFRISEERRSDAPAYCIFSQADLEDDLRGVSSISGARRKIRTFDSVCTVSKGDVVFSLLSGTAAVVQIEHDGYLLTQNYVLLSPSELIDPLYLVYLLNENREIKRQLYRSQQGSATMKYTLNQLGSLKLPMLPSREKQRLIGEVYFAQLKLEALRKREAELETQLVFGMIGKAGQL